MRRAPRLRRSLAFVVLVCFTAACAGGPPLHRDRSSRTEAPPPDVASPPPAPPKPASESAPHRPILDDRPISVRVGLHWDETPAVLEAAGEWTIEIVGEPARTSSGGELRVRAEGSTVRVRRENGTPAAAGDSPIRLTPRQGTSVTVDGRRFRGILELSARNDSLFVVETVPLEDYLRGVVPAEIGRIPADSKEAVAAQAIAARTYTIEKIGQYAGLPFDLFASVQDQVYDGQDGEDSIADAAIRETAGLVLSTEEGLADAYYSSTCGGRRSDIAVVWPHKPVVDYLRGGADGEGEHAWCRESPHFAWREAWSGTRLADLVRRHLPEEAQIDAGAVVGPILDLRVTRDDRTGRVREVEYRWKGGSARIPGDRNRWILRRPDGSILRSVAARFDVEKRGGQVVRVVATGGGNGHGVGMCQTGAIARARAGQDYREILEAYYPGTRIRPLEASDFPP